MITMPTMHELQCLLCLQCMSYNAYNAYNDKYIVVQWLQYLHPTIRWLQYDGHNTMATIRWLQYDGYNAYNELQCAFPGPAVIAGRAPEMNECAFIPRW